MTEPPRVHRLIVDTVVVLDPNTRTLHRRGEGLTAACGLVPRVVTMGAARVVEDRATRRCTKCWPTCRSCYIDLEPDADDELCSLCRGRELRW